MTVTPTRANAVQYVRMSTDMQDCSIAYQTAHNETYAAERGYKIIRTYADEGISGVGIERREALQALIGEASKGTADFDVVLVYDVSRWGRFQNPDESAYYEFLCAKAGIMVEYTSEPALNDGSLTATLVKAIKRVMAAEYSRELSIRQAASKRALLLRCLWTSGPAPYGYIRQLVDARGNLGPTLGYGEHLYMRGFHAVLKVVDAEADTVRRIFRLFLKGRTAVQIADRLNQDGVPHRPGRRWRHHTITYLLRNEIYTGVMIYGRGSSNLKRLVRQNPERVRIEGFAEPIISKRMFARAQSQLAARKPRKHTREELLEGLSQALAESGKLNYRIIRNSPHCPGVNCYEREFGGLIAAYRAVGFEPGERWRRATARVLRASETRAAKYRPPTDETLLGELRAVAARHGRLTQELIRETPGTRAPQTYRERFGGIGRAYELIGYIPSTRQKTSLRLHPWSPKAKQTLRPTERLPA